MAKNRHSMDGCPFTSSFDREVKKRFFPRFFVGRLTLLRGLIQDNEDANNVFTEIFNEDLESLLTNLSEEETNKITSLYGDEVNASAIMNTITSKLDGKKTLDSYEEKFLETYANSIRKFISDERIKDSIEKEMHKAGAQTEGPSVMYNYFKSKIPSPYRREVMSQILSIIIKSLDRAEASPAYKNFTRTEIIDRFAIKGSTLRGFEALALYARKILEAQYKQQKQRLEASNTRMDEEVEKLFNTLINDDNAWASCIYMAKSSLFDAEKVKIGSTLSYVEDVDEEDMNSTDPDKEVESAEEEGPEHWMVKSNTVSTFNSMSKEVRSILYKLTTGKEGIFGFPEIVDTLLIHQNLMSLRRDNYCQDSSEFLEVLANTKTSWAKELHDILVNDPYKRTAVFNVYKKNKLNYAYHRKESFYDKTLRRYFPVFYRNKSGRNTKVLMGAYRAGVLDIDASNDSCLFKADGTIRSEVLNAIRPLFLNNGRILEGVSLWNETEGIYDMKVWGATTIQGFTDEILKERQRDFILTINSLLNLHLDEADISSMMNSPKDFKNFCSGVHSLMNNLLKSGSINSNINFLLEEKTTRKYFQRIVRASKHTITVQERKSPTEKSFRFNKSTYMEDTVPNSIGDMLEKLGKYAAKGEKAFKQYLEDTYLSCPAFATKTNMGYVIHNYWLKEMYNSTEKDLKDPSSFVNRFINELTRGLGTDATSFDNFTEKDNILFTLNEFLQAKRDSGGKFGATPLFITGDSDSTRYLTTPILGSEEVLSSMVENVVQEIKRMRMMESWFSFLDNPDNVDPSSPDYEKRRKLKVSEGHGGKTIEEWEKEDVSKRPSVLRTKDAFTFFPFLNDYKDELFDLYNDAETLVDDGTGGKRQKDITKQEFRNKVRELLNKHLSDKYSSFIEYLKDKNIAVSIGNNAFLNSEALAVVDINGHTLMDTSADPSLLWNFYLNTKFNLIQQLQFLTIDPCFYKNTEDLQKRFKEVIASGDTLDLEALDPSDETGNTKIDDNDGKQNVIYSDEILTDLDASDEDGGSEEDRMFMQALRENKLFESIVGTVSSPKKNGKYNRNTLTDGQGWRSFTSYRKLMIMRGEPYWTKAHEEVYQIIKANRDAGRDRFDLKDPQQRAAFQRILDLGVVFQPLKPFYYGFEEIEKDGNKILIPVQHKYSEYPIIPELLPAGCRLGELGKAMEANKIDLVCCTTCVKVGGFGSTTIKHCKSKEDFSNAFKAGYTHKLNLNGWRQQSNIPEHVDSSRQVGSQFSKHGYGCMNESSGNKHYSFLQRVFPNGEIKLTKNVTIDVKDGLNFQNLIQLFGALGSAFYMHSSVKLNKQLSNPKEASAILSELRANDSRGAKDSISANTINDKGDMTMSPAEGIMAFDNMASLQSKLRKEVIKRPMKGGSAVQVSAFGFEDVLKVHCKKTPDGKTNIVYADCAVPFAFSFSYEDGTVVDLSSRYLEYVDHDSGMLLDEEGNPVEPAEPTGKPGEEFYGWNTKLGKQFPGILDMIAYRIPTEKDYSILNLKARRFFPKTAGGIIMVPSQFTTIAGFDFDIDKLYFIRREYKYKRYPSIDNYSIWTDFYEESELGKQIKPYLETAHKNAEKVEGFPFMGADDYNYWSKALEMMAAEGKDITLFPKTAGEAFASWVGQNASRYAATVSNYDSSKTVLENSQSAVNNLWFDYMQSRLEDYDTFSERYTPGGFQLLKDAKPIMMAIRYAPKEELAKLATSSNPEKDLLELAEKYKDYSPDYDPTELTTIAHYQTCNAISSRCISVSAVQNINQRLTALVNKLRLKVAIRFGSLLKPKVSGEKEEERLGRDIKARFINNSDTELLTTNFLASAVDAVKEALLEYFNIDDLNLNIGCLMAKIGCTATDIGLLFNQPVCVRALEIMKESKGFKSLSNSLDEALQEIDKNYQTTKDEFYSTLGTKKDGSAGERDSWTTTAKLIQYIGMNASPTYGGNLNDYIKGQFAVAHLMRELQAAAQELAEQVAITQSTSIKSVKSTFGAVQAVLQKVKRFASNFGGKDSMYEVELPSRLKHIIDPNLRFTEDNMEEVLSMCMESPYCIEQIAFSAIMGYAETIGDYFPYMSEGFTTSAEGLAALTKRGYISAEMFDVHNKAFMMFCLERMTSTFSENGTVKLLNAKGDSLDTGISKKLFYTEKFPMYLHQVLTLNDTAFKEGKTDVHYLDIPILGSIAAELEGYSKGKSNQHLILKMEGIGGLKGEQKDNLIASWEAMFSSSDHVLQDLAKHLFLYSYYNRGFDFGTTSFMSLVPLLVKTSLNEGEYAEFYNRVYNLATAPNGLLKENGGMVEDICLKDYYKAFILNTRNLFYHYTKKVYSPGNLRESHPYNIINKNMNSDRSEFTVTIGSEKDKPLLDYLGTQNKDDSGKVLSVAFTPCVEIDGAVYICDSNFASKTNGKFNVLESGTMHYYRMDVPIGTDYGTLDIYGTRAKSMSQITDDIPSEVLMDLNRMYNEGSSTGKGGIDDTGNVHGDETNAEFPKDHPLSEEYYDLLNMYKKTKEWVDINLSPGSDYILYSQNWYGIQYSPGLEASISKGIALLKDAINKLSLLKDQPIDTNLSSSIDYIENIYKTLKSYKNEDSIGFISIFNELIDKDSSLFETEDKMEIVKRSRKLLEVTLNGTLETFLKEEKEKNNLNLCSF